MALLPTVVIPAAATAVALVAVAYALRGRRVDDHPLCRRCGFDLFGKPAGSTVCSECGADLGRRRAVRVGHRQRRGRVLAVALPVLLLGLGWEGYAGWRAARATNWDRHKPVWWLVRSVDRGSPAARDAALNELARRIGEGKLPADVEAALVDRALALQADRAKPWAPAWGTVVETAEATKRLPPGKWDRYVNSAVELKLESADPDVRRGDAIVVRLVRGQDRAAGLKVEFTFTPERVVSVGGHEVSLTYTSGGDSWYSGSIEVPPGPTGIPPGGLLAKGRLELPDAVLDSLRDGPQELRAKVTLQREVKTSYLLSTLAVALFSAGIPPQSADVRGTFNLLPADPNAPPRFRAVGLLDGIYPAEAFEVSELVYTPDPSGTGRGVLTGTLTAAWEAPERVAVTVRLGPGATEHPAGVARFVPEEEDRKPHAIRVEVAEPLPRAADVILRRPGAAAEARDTGEAVLQNVPIRRAE